MLTKRAIAIIPAHNERPTVGQVIRAVLGSRTANVVLVVDDGSCDGTAEAAERAGAKVLRLAENGGKAMAVKAGAESLIRMKYDPEQPIVLLDADLVSLTSHHVDSLITPVLHGEADMTVGVFASGRSATDFAQKVAPFLSGQRAMRLSVLVQALAEVEVVGFGIEVALTRYAQKHGKKIMRVMLEGLTHVMKEEKLGIWAGTSARLKMYKDIAVEGARLLALEIKTKRS